MGFRLRFRVLLPALMATSILGGLARADLYLNDPYPRPGGDQAVSLSDTLFVQQSLDGTGCELKPVVDTDGDGTITSSDIVASLQNYGCNFPPCDLPGPATGTPIEILPDPGSPTYGLPGQTLVLTATVSNTISPSPGALINCINNAIVVDLDPFIEDDGIPVIFEITEDTGGGAYLGTIPGATTRLTWVNSPDSFDLSTGTAQVDLTLGNSGTVRVVARTRLLTDPPVWENVLQTFQADFPQIIVGALDIHITSPVNGTFLSTTVTDVTVTTTTAVGSTIYLKIDGVTHSEISHVVADIDWDPVKGWYEFTIPNVDLWIDTPGDRWVPLIAVIQATGGMSNIVDVYPDTTSPSVNITQPAPATTITTNLVTVTASCSDGGSGIASCRVWVDGKAEQESPGIFIIADGPHTAYARATDNVGNNTLATPVPFNVFSGFIWVTITSPTDGTIFATQDIPINGTYFNVGADPTITANGTTMTDDGTIPNGNWSGVVDTGVEGSVTITVTADDTFGTATASVNICVDALDPTASIVPLPCQASNTVVVTGTVDGTGTCGLVSVVVNPGTVIADVVGSNWTAVLTLSDGMGQSIDATATDAAGNTTVTANTVDVDTKPPVVTIASPTDGEVTNSTTVIVSGTATDGSASGVAVVLINGQTAAGTEDWSITFTGQTGNPSFSAVAMDSCGNQSSPQVVSIIIDLDLPTAELISPAEVSCWSSSAVRADAVCNDVGSKIVSCQVSIDGQDWQDVPVTISGLSDGPHIAMARAIDQGENESFSTPHSFFVDTTAPIVSISSPTPDSWSGGTVVITGTVSDAIGIGNSAMLCLGTTLDECVLFKFAGPLATPTYSESGSLDADFGDVDGDGDLDIVVANHNGQNRLYINDGNGIFTDGTTRMPPDSDLSYDVELADVNGDLALDIFVSNYGQNRLYMNDGNGIFTDETASRLPADSDQSRDGEFGDFNRDRRPDIIIANYEGQNRLYLNDGFGFFSDATEQLPEDNDGSFDIEVGDVDLDSDLDIFVSNWAEQNRLYLNNGFGIFADATSHLPEDTDYTRDADLIDVNGDFYPDLVIANYFGQNRLYLNDGNWGGGEPSSFLDYTYTNLPALVDNSIDIALADIDGDGDPDLVVANYDQQNRLYLNDGSGIFSDITDPHLPADMNRSRDADFGDVDGDGDPDIIIANYLEQNLLYINNYGTVVQTVPVDPATGDFAGAFFNVSQGSYTATVISWDSCGNSSSASVSFNVDTTLPLVSITSPTNGDLLNSSTLAVAGTATDSDSGIYQITVNGVIAEIFDGTWVATLNGQPEGSLTLIANAMDFAYNSAYSTPVSVFIDYTPPAISITYPNSGDCINSTVVIVNGTVTEEGSGVAVITVEAGIYTATGTSFPITMNIPADGVYTITAQAEDNCGNIGLDTVNNVQIDTVPPTVNVSSPGDGECVTVSTITVEGSASPDVIEIIASWGAYSAIGTNFPVFIDVSGVADGTTNDLVVSVTDDCGNPGSSTVNNIQVDTAAIVTIVSPSEGQTIYSNNVAVTGTADTDIATVLVTSDQGHYESSPVDSDGNWSVTLTGVIEPSIIIDAQGTDDCGNTGSDSVTVPVSFGLLCLIFVNDDATGAGTGESWTNAYTVIQDAVDVSTSGDIICVAEGVYTSTSFSSVLTMKDGVDIYGGFIGTENSPSERGNPAEHPTVLDGEGMSFHVVVGASNARLDGFLLTGGSANGGDITDPEQRGGGMYNSFSSPIINNCIFAGNAANQNGGGIYNSNSSPEITNCIFVTNWALLGGGMINESSSPIITNCLFISNMADYGGGVYNTDDSSPEITNCTFTNNWGFVFGGGIYNLFSSPIITNCILWGDNFDEIYDDSSNPTVTYCDIQGGYPGPGNISDDPLFVTGTRGDYYLSHIAAGQGIDSPCIDAGSDTAASLGLDDKTTRTDSVPDTGIVDMGYHYEPLLPPEILAVDDDGAEPYDNIVPSGIPSNWQIYGNNFIPGSPVVGCFDGPICSCFGIAGQTAICIDLDGLPGGMLMNGDVLSSGEIDTTWEILGSGGPVNLYIENPDGQIDSWGPSFGDLGITFE